MMTKFSKQTKLHFRGKNMENFVKIDGITYFESQLRLMNEGQLNHLIERCQKGIDEIAMKKTDYENCNYNE